MSLGFLKSFLRDPSSVGAIWPSSRNLAKVMVRASAVESAASVVELGPGCGAFTGEIIGNLSKGAHFAAIEKCPIMAREVAKKFPEARIIEGCATQLGSHLKSGDIPSPDAILSGLPWAIFSDDLQTAILREVHDSLAGGGVFSTFAYYGPHRLPSGAGFRSKLERIFREVERSPVVVWNIPPAFIYTCRRR